LPNFQQLVDDSTPVAKTLVARASGARSLVGSSATDIGMQGAVRYSHEYSPEGTTNCRMRQVRQALHRVLGENGHVFPPGLEWRAMRGPDHLATQCGRLDAVSGL
jgi:hypothetical protein